MRRRVKAILWAVGLVCVPLLLTGTSGGLAYFSPYTLEYTAQSEFTILWGTVPIFRSPRSAVDNELITFIQQEGFVTAEQPVVQRWEEICHVNRAWRGGYSSLHRVLNRNRYEIIEWSRADPERARIYWSEGFKHLRGDTKADLWIGQWILETGWRCRNIPELREQIEVIKKEVGENPRGAVRR